MIFQVLAERADDALFAADGGLKFPVKTGKGTPVIAAEGVEHGLGEVRESLQGQLQLVLEIRVLRAFVGHDSEFGCQALVFRWFGNICPLCHLAQFPSRHAEFASQFDQFSGQGKLLLCLPNQLVR